MNVYIWLFVLIVIALISLIVGMFFLVIDLQRPRSQWRFSMFLTDILLLTTFILSSGFAIYVYLLLQKQIDFFS